MNKMPSRLLSQVKFRQNSHDLFNSKTNILLKHSNLSDHIVRREYIQMPRNISVQLLDKFKLEEIESDEIEFVVNAQIAFTKRMKFASIQLVEIGMRLSRLEMGAKNLQKEISQMRQIVVNQADRIQSEQE